MISATFFRFVRARRSAVAITMAVAILPLMLLVGIAIDFTLLSQARSQAAFAAQAAATHAVRVAASTYALEEQNAPSGDTPTQASATAVAHALAAANSAGDLWWGAELGTLSQGYVSYEHTNTTSTNSNSSPPNFTAAVAYTITYPPIFDPLFGQPNTKWVYASSATATAQFAYAQILMLLDTSNSMLIGARQSDIITMEEHAVCQPSTILPGFGATDKLTYNTAPNTSKNYNPNDYNFLSSDGTWIGFQSTDTPQALNYNSANTATGTEPANASVPGGTSPYFMNGKCNSGFNASDPDGTSVPYSPCALACHNETSTFAATTTVNGVTASRNLPADLYGLARSEGVELRVDVLLSATEAAISDMATTEAVNGQISVGVYQFNSDIQPIARGTQSGDALPEATSNLTYALQQVQAVDYNQNPNETSIPALVTDCSTYNFPTQENCNGNTNLVLSLQHLVAGKLPTDSGAQPLTSSGAGALATTPIKFMFLITDGMEDESAADGATDLTANPNFGGKGDMTSLSDNTAVSSSLATPGTCTAIKKLGYILYVLYVDYLPVSQSQYYNDPGVLNSQTTSDFPTVQYLHDVADSEPYINSSETAAQQSANIAANVPTAEALAQCASSPSYFYSANSDTDIQTALNAMLKSALASTTRLTN